MKKHDIDIPYENLYPAILHMLVEIRATQYAHSKRIENIYYQFNDIETKEFNEQTQIRLREGRTHALTELAMLFGKDED